VKKLLQHKRTHAISAGVLVANFFVALIVFQFGVPLHPNVVATGAPLLAAGVNFLVSKYLS
jgi:hypothetical protein